MLSRDELNSSHLSSRALSKMMSRLRANIGCRCGAYPRFPKGSGNQAGINPASTCANFFILSAFLLASGGIIPATTYAQDGKSEEPKVEEDDSIQNQTEPVEAVNEPAPESDAIPAESAEKNNDDASSAVKPQPSGPPAKTEPSDAPAPWAYGRPLPTIATAISCDPFERVAQTLGRRYRLKLDYEEYVRQHGSGEVFIDALLDDNYKKIRRDRDSIRYLRY
jgi:hypothetical protein